MVRFFVGCCLVSTTALAQPMPPPQSPPGPPVVVTTGEATVKRAPDRAWVTIAAESRARTPQDAQKTNADAMSAVMQKLKGANLPDDAIRTASYDLQPEFDYNNGRQTLRGYVARNAIEVRVDQVDRIGQVLELAVSAGATNVRGVRFDLKDRAAAEREALTRAVANARARADAAGKGAGMTVERVLRIEESDSVVPPPPVPMTMRSEVGVAAQPPMSPGELEITVVVTLTAAIK
jgi:uncharacterized protein YggE